jgi:predicted nucleic acid-binding protein
MPGPFVIDASVFLNAFNTAEAGHAESQKLLAHLQDKGVPVIGPTLLLPEVAATIGRGQGDPNLARRFAFTLSRLPHLVLIPLDRLLAGQAVEIAAQYRLRGSDAVYAAVALRFGCPLVTLDREQHDRVAIILPTRYPVDALADLNGEASSLARDQ